jgi:hypothetical protein
VTQGRLAPVKNQPGILPPGLIKKDAR